jgi:hypothetical protein
MTTLIIVVVVFLALAPLWHFMPTKRQRSQARLREAAALAGLFVEFRDLPLPPARRERLPAAERQVLYYGRRLKPGRKKGRARSDWGREGDGWGGSGPPPEIAAALPDSVLALSVSDASCGCYWREEGDEETVRGIAGLLADWAASLEAGD